MRSVFFHLVGATRQAVAGRLSAFATANGPDGWLLSAGSSDPVLYVGFYDHLLVEAEPASLESIQASLGTMPHVSLVVDVSGRVPGDVELREVAALILTAFEGVAQDDYTSHCWTLAEIQKGMTKCGHPFFDYDGWYRESHV